MYEPHTRREAILIDCPKIGQLRCTSGKYVSFFLKFGV